MTGRAPMRRWRRTVMVGQMLKGAAAAVLAFAFVFGTLALAHRIGLDPIATLVALLGGGMVIAILAAILLDVAEQRRARGRDVERST